MCEDYFYRTWKKSRDLSFDRINDLGMDGLYSGAGGAQNGGQRNGGAAFAAFGRGQDRLDGNRENRNPNLNEGKSLKCSMC